MTQTLMSVFAPVLLAIICLILARIFKKLGLDIDAKQAEAIIWKIVEIVIDVENSLSHRMGKEKKADAINEVTSKISNSERKLLERYFGGVSTAVEKAYHLSYIPTKKMSSSFPTPYPQNTTITKEDGGK